MSVLLYFKIGPYNFELYRFKVGAFFETQYYNTSPFPLVASSDCVAAVHIAMLNRF